MPWVGCNLYQEQDETLATLKSPQLWPVAGITPGYLKTKHDELITFTSSVGRKVESNETQKFQKIFPSHHYKRLHSQMHKSNMGRG